MVNRERARNIQKAVKAEQAAAVELASLAEPDDGGESKSDLLQIAATSFVEARDRLNDLVAQSRNV